MPTLDGFGVLEQIRRMDTAAGRSSVAISLTAHASAAFADRTRAAGFDAHLAKPYRVADLINAIADTVAISERNARPGAISGS